MSFAHCKEREKVQEVAERARELGSPEVIPVPADDSKADDCKRIIDERINILGNVIRQTPLNNGSGSKELKKFE